LNNINLSPFPSDKADQEKQNVIFDFSAKHTETYGGGIEVKATLYNITTDTICFLTTGCFGEQYSLRYDTSKIELFFAYCNVDSPALVVIKPKSKHEFIARFGYKKKMSISKIKLGFDFNQVDKSFDITKIKLGEIYNRTPDKQNVIWAKEKVIQ